MRSAPPVALLAIFAACTPAARAPVAPPVAAPSPLRFRVGALPGAVVASGRIVVAMTNVPAIKDPRQPPGFVAAVNDVWYAAAPAQQLAPGEAIFVDPDRLSSPGPLSRAPSGTWRVAATFEPDASPGEPRGEPLTSAVVEKAMDPSHGGVVELLLEAPKSAALPVVDTDTMKIVRAPSKRLSAFFGRAMTIDAVVLLPASYGKDPQRTYGTVYDLPGFGSTVERIAGNAEKIRKRLTDTQEPEEMRVIVPATFGFGHHGFVDSVNDGPWLSAFVDDLVPRIEAQFRVVKKPEARLLSGHSSGGWGSLWVILHRPEVFAGTWSSSPDPVDLRSFSDVDVTPGSNDNLFHQSDGSPHGFIRMNGQDTSTIERYLRWETVVIGGVGALTTFEGEWSPRGMDGKPWPLFDRATGALHQETLKAWEAYDIRKLLEASWPKLGPKLKGKLHLFCGRDDNFHLDGAFEKLCATLAAKGSDATCELIPGRDHFDLFGGATPNDLALRVARERGETLSKAGIRVTP